MDLHTDGNAVPAVDDTELGDVLDALGGWHAAIDMLRDAARLIATERLTLEQTQDLTVVLAGMTDGTDALSLIGGLHARITNPDTNPCLRTLPFEQQKRIQRAGENLVRHLADPDLHQHAANASGAIHTD